MDATGEEGGVMGNGMGEWVMGGGMGEEVKE